MKRLSILFAAVLLFSISSYAQNGDEYNVLWSLNQKTTQNTVTDYVKASPEQSEQLQKIFYDSTQLLVNALTDNSKNDARKALYYNIANAKSVLSQKQFKKYLEILNITYHQQQENFTSMVDNK
ncbi:putative membrane protein [Dysgonomonas sp. PFB1-18]|uniref:hypothetical protein n=1 Tax=unclassified Dysgonomonas TaxID=2630389 RepID=UPI00247339A7|nr:MULTISPECIES: hypothetical protein [unclassified Dysgonomonas]MDH6307661.1 putative membrane protein [Dysgonomonas sp. PF1-14]MDH6337579.1 putative membrane protein [Dysgonomonas sp. PF1-16]MDH6378803.1 putative membrane protein [Dysgonomonas sp. PFB1-18]MDH6396438.1 putative membrane protein [Dysgonomonas sp. PF1-23]